MKIKLTLTRGDKKETLITNLFAIAEWERLENRRVSDGRGIGASDLACWVHTLLVIKGEKLPATWREWLKQNPNMDIEAVDTTDPNPTDAAPTAAN